MRTKNMFLLGFGFAIFVLILFNQEILAFTHNLITSKWIEGRSSTEVEEKQTVCTIALPAIPFTVSGSKKPIEQFSVENMDFSQVLSLNEIFIYLSSQENRQRVLARALQLNDGQHSNACVYFISETLRQNNVLIPEATSNTNQLMAQLNHLGWRCNPDYKDLRPGDICFTTSESDSSGTPSHTYVFMGWVSPDNDFAMVCDNQADRYGSVYHKRNITKIYIYKGEKKEAFQFFMRQ